MVLIHAHLEINYNDRKCVTIELKSQYLLD